jgi:hypothetical protein
MLKLLSKFAIFATMFAIAELCESGPKPTVLAAAPHTENLLSAELSGDLS